MDSVEPLLSRTYRLVNEAGLSYQKIAVGSGLTKDWVAKFCQRAIGEPGVTKVQAVHDFLVSHTAETGSKRRARKVAAGRLHSHTRNE